LEKKLHSSFELVGSSFLNSCLINQAAHLELSRLFVSTNNLGSNYVNSVNFYTNNIFGDKNIAKFNAISVLDILKLVVSNLKNSSAFLFLLCIIFGLGINNLSAQTPQIKNVKAPLNKIASNNLNTSNLELYPGTFQGAEMFYKQINENEIEIFLAKYFHCETLTIDSFEHVNVFESIANVPPILVELKLIEVIERTPIANISCVSIEKTCVKKLTYSGKVNIMNPMFGGYEVTWGFCCWDGMTLKNIEGMQESILQGSVLDIHIPDLRGGEMNSSPIYNSDPILTSCRGQLLAINHSATDIDKDSLVFEITGLDNYTVERQYKVVPEPELEMGKFQQKTFAANKPPYKKITYRKNYSGAKPLGSLKQLSIDTKTGELQLKSDSIGDFLIGVSVKEIRNKKELGTYQRVYKLKVIE
jgi:hypothetical protein